jgi:hypothetical protein
MPEGAEILAVGIQDYTPVIWALVTPSRPYVQRTFVGVATGTPVEDGVTYLGTFTTPDGLVFHLFERVSS